MSTRLEKKLRRRNKTRKKVFDNTRKKYVLKVFRSNIFFYVQVFDVLKSVVLFSVSDMKIKQGNKTDKAKKVGENLAKLCLEKKVNDFAFDRREYKYIGRIKAFADSARENGLKF